MIIIVNMFRYINNNVTKDTCRFSIPMDMTIVLGLHKLSLQVTIPEKKIYFNDSKIWSLKGWILKTSLDM